MKWKALVPVVIAALVVPTGGTAHADAVARGTGGADAGGGTYRIRANGNPILGWAPTSGTVDQTSDDTVRATGTMVGDFGSAAYDIAAGPGIVTTKLSGSFSGPGGFSNPFGPTTQAVSTTELTINGPQTELNTSLNLHVDGFLDIPVCGGGSQCGALNVHIGTSPFGRQAEFDTLGTTRANSLGLAFDPVPGGFHVHGDVIGTAFGMPTNTPEPITISIDLGGGFGAVPDLSTFSSNFNDPVRQLQVSFDPAKPVLNDIPAGFTVSGSGVVDNHWTDPFADVAVSSCAMLSQLTVVTGNLTIHNLAGCPTISLPNLTHVGGNIIVDGVDATATELGPDLSVGGAIEVNSAGGDLTISQTTVGEAIDVSSTGGDLTIEDNTVGEGIDVSSTGGDLTVDENTVGEPIDASGTTGGDLTIVDNGDAVVNTGNGQVGGDLTIETTGDSFSGTTAGGSTSVTILDAPASMHALLPTGAFDHPVAFTVARSPETPPEAGTAPDGSAALIDPVLGYQFSFAIPTLDADAQLTFTVDLSQLDAVGRAQLLDAIANGNGTITVKGDAANAVPHAFAQCQGPEVPTAEGCVAVSLLNASGTPAGPGEAPAFARFDGVVGHFSSYAVARVLAVDSTAPAITAPTGLTVDATGPGGALVRYAVSARDDHDAAPGLTCAPASGSVLPIGDTTVVCDAKDASGNASRVRFVAHVRGATEQLRRLTAASISFLRQRALRPAIKAVLHRAGHAVAAKRPRAACHALHGYITMVKRSGRAFTAGHRAQLVADAVRVRSVLGC